MIVRHGRRAAAHLAVWYPTQFWSAYATPSPLDGDVHAIAWDADHVRLFVGGTFTNAGGNPNADFLAMWDRNNWALGFAYDSACVKLDLARAHPGEKLLAAGRRDEADALLAALGSVNPF